MALLGVLKQVSAGFQQCSKLEAELAQGLGVIGGDAQNHPGETHSVPLPGRPRLPNPSHFSATRDVKPSSSEPPNRTGPLAPFSPCTARQPPSPVQFSP